jgi:hypothetical protein
LPATIAAPDHVHAAAAVAVLPGQLAWQTVHGKPGRWRDRRSSIDSESLAINRLALCRLHLAQPELKLPLRLCQRLATRPARGEMPLLVIPELR